MLHNAMVKVINILPRPFPHRGPTCLQYPYFFDVVTKTIDVVTNYAQTTLNRYALNFSRGEPLLIMTWHAYRD